MKLRRGRRLRGLQQIRIEGELENRAPARLLRELRVHHLVRPCAEAAGTLDTAQQIGSPEPATVSKRGLDDEIGAGPHGIQRLRDRMLASVRSDVESLQPTLEQLLYVKPLVVESTLLQQSQGRIDPGWRRPDSLRDREVERGAVAAGEEVR
jgi:hypothetical protein